MTKLSFERIAITAFLEPGGFGPLWVWSMSASQAYELCMRPKFDPNGDIETLLLGGPCAEDHAGRAAFELHVIQALSHPEADTRWIESASRLGQRIQTLTGAQSLSLDHELGFLDLLIHIPSSSASMPRHAKASPSDALIQGFFFLWGADIRFCGLVDEESWDTYAERAIAVKSLMDRAELIQATSGPECSTSGTKRL
jgi:hypothetical protein